MPSEVDARLLARIAHHELGTLLALQRSLLHAAGPECGHHPNLLLAEAATEEMVGVLDLLTGLAQAPAEEPCLPLRSVLRSVVATTSAVPDRLSRAAAAAPVHAVRTRSVLGNLLDNAVRHSGEHGPVTVVGRMHRRTVRLRLLHPGACPSEVRRALAAPDPPQGRRGLGLWLVGRLVVDMAGTIRVHAPAERPWEIRIGLPVATPAPAVA